ncbi:LysR family transcriptional regulator [Aeromonas bivalvium]|uniref:LysR family transcriptional regulator n=1 Tax=Aeromonas bivalvium TaxID=440079 RepID=UPI0038CFE02B
MSKADLNLVVIFDAIMQEQSVTAAAQRLAMTQPAVSNALTRMRHTWQDPLFVKAGRGLKPTPFAVALWQQIAAPLSDIRHAVAPPDFDPASSEQTFRIALTNGLTSLYWGPLRQHIEAHAPGINIHAVPYVGQMTQQLEDAEADLVLGSSDAGSEHVQMQVLFENPFVVAMAPNNVLAKGILTLEDFIAADQLLVSLSGQAQGIVDTCLAKQGLRRRLAMTLNSFAGAIELVRTTSLITVLPYPIVADSVARGDIVTRKLPLQVPASTIYMAWHRRDVRNASLCWLKNVIADLTTQLIASRLLPIKPGTSTLSRTDVPHKLDALCQS